MALSHFFASTRQPTPADFLPGAAAALRRHVSASGLGEYITPNVIRSLSDESRLLASERSASLAFLVLLSHESAGGARSEDAYPAVLAMECLLAAGDILDDIQDNELEEKGWDSAATAAETMAALLVLAHGALACSNPAHEVGCPESRALRKLIRLESVALKGQSADVRTTSLKTSHLDAMGMTRAKSGALGRCAAELGACVATDDEQVIEQHGDFGEHIAVIFQLMNDIEGIWPTVTRHSDVLADRPTPLLEFHSKLSNNGVNSNPELGGVSADYIAVDQAAEDVARSGAVQFTWAIATAELVKAKRKAYEIATSMPRSRLSILLQR